MTTEAIIEDFINGEVLFGGGEKIDPDKDLFSTGLLDSLAVMQLILFIQERFGVYVTDNEVMPDNFRTINLMKSFIETKKRAAAIA